MNSRIKIFTLLIFLGGTFSANFAQAQTPQIAWQTPLVQDKSYLSLKFTADGSQLFAGGDHQFSSGFPRDLLRKYNAETGAQLATTGLNFGWGVNEIALSPDGQKIVTANANASCSGTTPPLCDGSFQQYDPIQLAQTNIGRNSNQQNKSIDYSPNGQLIALGGVWANQAGTDYQNLILVRASDLTVVRVMPGHLRAPNDGGTLKVRFSPDGTLLGTSGRDKFVKIWRVSDGALLRSIQFDDAYLC